MNPLREPAKTPLASGSIEVTDQHRENELEAIFDHSPMIMVVLDERCRIRRLNAQALQWASDALKDLAEVRPGDLLRCLNALDDPRGCGFGAQCDRCEIRHQALDTMTTGRSHYQVEVEMPLAINGEIHHLPFAMSSSRFSVDGERRTLVSLIQLTSRRDRSTEAADVCEGRCGQTKGAARAVQRLQTPIRAIVGFSEALLTGRVSPDQTNKVLTTIRDNGERLLRMVDGFWEKLHCEVAAPESGAGKRIADHAFPAPTPAPRRTVLLAEDNTDMQALLKRMLCGLDLRVEIAENGRIACEKALASREAGNTYDAIVMDIQMPEMDGFEAVRALRRQGWDRPILALTAYAMIGDREKCLAAGCDHYLSKPVQVRELQETLARCLRNRPNQ